MSRMRMIRLHRPVLLAHPRLRILYIMAVHHHALYATQTVILMRVLGHVNRVTRRTSITTVVPVRRTMRM